MNKDLILSEFGRVSEAMGWDLLHSPRNLTTAISIEAAKLLQNFQWLSDVESELVRDEADINKIAADIADLFIYLTVLCHKMDLDPWSVVKDKLVANRRKFVEQIISRDYVEQVCRAYQPVQPPLARIAELSPAGSEANNEVVDLVAVAKKIANSRLELETLANELKCSPGNDDSKR